MEKNHEPAAPAPPSDHSSSELIYDCMVDYYLNQEEQEAAPQPDAEDQEAAPASAE